jgi:ABC-type transport system involved in multi-copper enzyme maturation permease subunit
MTAALAYEWVRIRTIRSTWWLTGLALTFGVGISALISWAVAREFSRTGVTASDLDGLGAGVVTQLSASGETPSVVSFVLAILGVFAWGHEYRHGMIRASLTALNSRSALWVAKYAVVGVWVAVVTFVTMVLSGAVGVLYLHDYVTIFSGETWSIIGRQVLYALLLTWIAMGFTALTRSQAFALVMMFLWPLLIESLFYAFFYLVPGLGDDIEVLRFLPFNAGNRMVAVLGDEVTSTFGDPLSPLGGTIVFGGLAVVLMAASFTLFRKRDA